MSRPIYSNEQSLQLNHRLLLGFAVLGGALTWFAHFMFLYFVGEFSCVLDGTVFLFMNLTAAQMAMLAATGLALVLTFIAMVVSLRLRNPSLWTSGPLAEVGEKERRFLGNFALVSNVIFHLAVLAQTMPILFLSRGC